MVGEAADQSPPADGAVVAVDLDVDGAVADVDRAIAALDVETSSQPLTLEIARNYWSSKADSRRELIAGLEAIEPPEEAAEMHESAIGVVSRLAAADESVAELVETMETDQELTRLAQSPEFLANETVDEDAVAMCQAAQAELDTSSDEGIIADTPWIPSGLHETVIVVFGCTKEERGIQP